MAARARTKAPLVLPASVVGELEEVSARLGRSVAFVVHGSLAASPAAADVEGETRALALALGEDDPKDLLTKLTRAAGDADLARRVTGAWAATRERWRAAAERQATAGRAAKNEALDRALEEAASATSAEDRLRALAKSDVPKVRALVAGNPSAPADVVAALANDRERTVREAASGRG